MQCCNFGHYHFYDLIGCSHENKLYYQDNSNEKLDMDSTVNIIFYLQIISYLIFSHFYTYIIHTMKALPFNTPWWQKILRE